MHLEAYKFINKSEIYAPRVFTRAGIRSFINGWNSSLKGYISGPLRQQLNINIYIKH